MLTDIAQLLDLGLTGVLLVAVVILWRQLVATQKELVNILREVAGLKAQLQQAQEEQP